MSVLNSEPGAADGGADRGNLAAEKLAAKSGRKTGRKKSGGLNRNRSRAIVVQRMIVERVSG